MSEDDPPSEKSPRQRTEGPKLTEVSDSTNTAQAGGRQAQREVERLVEEITGIPFSVLYPPRVAASPEPVKAETINGNGSQPELDLDQVRRKLTSKMKTEIDFLLFEEAIEEILAEGFGGGRSRDDFDELKTHQLHQIASSMVSQKKAGVCPSKVLDEHYRA